MRPLKEKSDKLWKRTEVILSLIISVVYTITPFLLVGSAKPMIWGLPWWTWALIVIFLILYLGVVKLANAVIKEA